ESSSKEDQNQNPSASENVASPITPKQFVKFVKVSDSQSKSTTDEKETPEKPPVKDAEKYIKPNRNLITSFNKSAHSYTNRPFQRKSTVRSQYRAPWVPTVNRNFPPVNRKFSTGSRNFPTVNKKFSTASRNFPTGSTKGPIVDMGMKGKVVKPSACWSWKLSQNLSNKGPKNNSVSVMFKKYTYIDTQGRLKHMTGNISYLSDFEPFDGGYVSFGQGGCKITGKGTIKIECIVLGRDFKLLDDANILHRTPRQHNMYSINLNNIVPHRDLTCLVTKASADECMLWHRRLGHLNVKTMNKLVRHNLVRGLPTKCFENDHTCTACLKGKQHKASCKSKLVNSVTKPLYTLHMDLFGPTSVSSISHKWYCLVVTDDFSRFTWTFFLKSKDETSGILKKFITKIENL
nr:putative ribonuclease H-like domain-containing protein [Tanacetum cinerariifolium]